MQASLRHSIALISSLFTASMGAGAAAQTVIPADAETAPVSHPSTAETADDIAIWLHPTDVAKSTLIATDKAGSLVVYSLSPDAVGAKLFEHNDGLVNNVDLRYGFPLGASSVALVAASDRTSKAFKVRFYRVDESTRDIVLIDTPITAAQLGSGFEPYGLCMYRSQVGGAATYYLFVTSKGSKGVKQFKLTHDGSGGIRSELVRSLSSLTQTEGCVADDELGYFYLAEEDIALWRYGADPASGGTRVQVAATGGVFASGGDIEGVTLYYGKDGAGYVIASDQKNSEFEVFERRPPAADQKNVFVKTFKVGGGSIDEVTGSDGVDVTPIAIGSLFPAGLFVTQDETNPGDNRNFKLVSWASIADSAPALVKDSTYDPRSAPGTVEPTTPPPSPPAPPSPPTRTDAGTSDATPNPSSMASNTAPDGSATGPQGYGYDRPVGSSACSASSSSASPPFGVELFALTVGLGLMFWRRRRRSLSR